jgi:dephospho-CoA kinase
MNADKIVVGLAGMPGSGKSLVVKTARKEGYTVVVMGDVISRHRSDDPDGWELFHERDMRELSVGLGNAIAMAEHLIVNENKREYTKAKVKEILRMIEEKWKR